MAPETQRIVDKMNAKHVSNPSLSNNGSHWPCVAIESLKCG